SAIVPQKPRKSRFGRLTYCTGKRKSAFAEVRLISTDSSVPINVSPVYHGVLADLFPTLSPFNAEIGVQMMCDGLRAPDCATNAAYSARISLKRASEKSTRSVVGAVGELLAQGPSSGDPAAGTLDVWGDGAAQGLEKGAGVP